MTIEEIRKNAPDEATHYQIDEDEDEDDYIWYFKSGFMWFNSKWIPVLKWHVVGTYETPLN